MIRLKHFLGISLIILFSFVFIPMKASAESSAYDRAYNIDGAISFAITHAYDTNYSDDYQKGYDADCTNFVSSILHFGGKLDVDSDWYYNNSSPSETWINTPALFEYLKSKGYYTVSFESWQDSAVASFVCRPGDVVFYDWGTRGGWIDGLGKNDGKPDHAAFCVGVNEDGIPLVAAHSVDHQCDPIILDNGSYGTYKVYVVQMSRTAGLLDVTSRYVGKTVALRSLEVEQYVSSNTDQKDASVYVTANRSTASTWELFDVTQGDYGAVGFRAHGNNNYLSTRIDENASSSPIRACAPTYQSYETFRIYEKSGIQYIQSQVNGKWVQVIADNSSHPLNAGGSAASTWEQFQIEIIDPFSDSGTGSNPSDESAGENYSEAINVSQHYHLTDYIEGWYEGSWSNGHPNGWGRLTYDDFDDGKYFALYFSDKPQSKALYYEGYFSNGTRYGSGTVVYEDGWKDEGIFYGLWEAGKVVFEGKRWHGNGYWPLTITATSSVSSKEVYGEWHSEEKRTLETYTITYNANGGTGAPIAQIKTQGTLLTLSNLTPVREGFLFLGWSVSRTDATVRYEAGDSFSLDADTELFAVWKQEARSATIIAAYLGRETTPAYNDEEVVFTDYEIIGYATGDIWLTFEDLATGEQIYRYGPVTSSTRSSLLTRYLLIDGHTYRIFFTASDYSTIGDSYIDFTYKSCPAFSISTPSEWAREAIQQAYEADLIPTYMMQDYSSITTRIDYVRLAYAAIKMKYGWVQQLLYDRGLVDSMDAGPRLVFTDVPKDCGYDAYDQYRVAALNALGVINGVGDNRFDPFRAITREEAAALLNRLYALLQWGEVKSYSFLGSTDYKYDDNQAISTWAYYDVYNMKAVNVMNGVGNNLFNPKGAYTIEQSITTLLRIIRLCES